MAADGFRETVTIKIDNLAADATDEKILQFLRNNGVITTAFRRNVRKGFGFLDLDDAADLETALGLSGKSIRGHEITVTKAEPRTPNNRPGETKVLFVKNLSFSTTSEGLRDAFESAVSARVVTRDDGKSKGFGYVDFENGDDAIAAFEEMKGAEIDGRVVHLDFAAERGTGGTPRRTPRYTGSHGGSTKVLFVKNLSYDTTPESLQDAFEGSTSARVMMRDDGKSKGFGFVDFDSVEDAEASFDVMQGADVDGRAVYIDFASERGSGGGGGFRGGRGGFRGGRGDRSGFRGRNNNRY